jgi:signal transduction histidine kinase/CHASE1-domain containing sensor protein/ActR/RegA family two-component response regulator
MALAAWLSIHAAVTRDQENWIQTELNKAENAIHQRFGMYLNSLVQTRAFFIADSMPFPKRFRNYVAALDLQNNYPGLLGYGYAPCLDRDSNKCTKFTKDFRAPISMIEPLNTLNKRAVDFDMASESNRFKAMEEARDQDKTVVTCPVRLVQEHNTEPQKVGFLIYMPVYQMLHPSTIEMRRQNLKGFVFAALQSEEFLQAAFGVANFKDEKVNISVSYKKGEMSNNFYRRFAINDYQPALNAEKTLSGPLSLWHLRVESLPHAFPLYYRFFPDLVGMCFLFGAGLIIYSIRSTSEQFYIEDQIRDRLIQSEKSVRSYSETMMRLNRASKAIFSEIGLDNLLAKIAFVTADFAQLPAVAVFTVNTANGENVFRLRHTYGGESHLRFHQITSKDFEALLASNAFELIHSNSMDGPRLASKIFTSPPATWVLIPVMKAKRAIGFIVGFSDKYHPLEEPTLTLLEGVSRQIAIALENSFLFARAEESSRLKSSFLANMSHEIRTPLGAIVGYADMLVRETRSSQERGEINEHMRKNVNHVIRIIDDILDLSKVEANKLNIISRLVSTSSVLNEVKSIMERKAKERGIGFKISFSSTLPSSFFTDEVRLKQILTNLLGNAIKFTESGRVELIVNYVESEVQLYFRIRDTGCGMNANAQAHLFEAFSQGDFSTTRRFGGTGLGLALSRQLARLLGGDVELVKSEPGQGSEFLVRIQAEPDVAPTWIKELESKVVPNSKTPSIERDSLKDRKILLVEDSEDNQDIFKYFLESAGAQVTIAGTGKQALAKTLNDDYDLILMDIQIPELDGKETTRILRKQGWRKPIIALTAHGFAEEQKSVLAAGCDDQITKPVTGDELIHRVGEILTDSNSIY